MTDGTGGPCRLARPDEIEIVRDIQRKTGRMFLDTPYPEVATHEPDSAEDLADAQDKWRLWVSVTGEDRPAGAMWVLPRDGDLHIRQLDVHPDFSGERRTVGLVRAVKRFFGGRGLSRLTLTTFSDVPWNAPYYERIGFSRLAPDNLSAALAEALTEEATRYPVERRVAMEMPF